MKKIIVSTLMFMFAASAFATETAYVLEPLLVGRGEYAEPCPQTPEAPTPANGLCYEGRECPVGYESVAKYCWNGGLHRCGIACRNDRTLNGR